MFKKQNSLIFLIDLNFILNSCVPKPQDKSHVKGWYTRYPIVARALPSGCSAFSPSLRASKVILHTSTKSPMIWFLLHVVYPFAHAKRALQLVAPACSSSL